TTSDFLRSSINARREEGNEVSLMKFIKEMDGALDDLEIDKNMAQRYLNEGFSGGEKKRNEILHLMMLKPGIAILDEVDSGLAIAALKDVVHVVYVVREVAGSGCVIATHYQRLRTDLKADDGHTVNEGKNVKAGGAELVAIFETEGYYGVTDVLGMEDGTI